MQQSVTPGSSSMDANDEAGRRPPRRGQAVPAAAALAICAGAGAANWFQASVPKTTSRGAMCSVVRLVVVKWVSQVGASLTANTRNKKAKPAAAIAVSGANGGSSRRRAPITDMTANAYQSRFQFPKKK